MTSGTRPLLERLQRLAVRWRAARHARAGILEQPLHEIARVGLIVHHEHQHAVEQAGRSAAGTRFEVSVAGSGYGSASASGSLR